MLIAHHLYWTVSVDKDLLEPGCSVLLHHKSSAIIGVLSDDSDPSVNVCVIGFDGPSRMPYTETTLTQSLHSFRTPG